MFSRVQDDMESKNAFCRYRIPERSARPYSSESTPPRRINYRRERGDHRDQI
jgi:hypothetical protein